MQFYANKPITIVIIDCLEPYTAAQVLTYCAKKWGIKNRILFTHYPLSFKGISVNQITQIDSIKKYNEFILRELYKFIDTEYCLVMQTDGFILNHKKWTNSFLQYDYIGAPLPNYPIWISQQLDIYKQAIKNCNKNKWPLNGGFSLRSKKLLELTAQCPYPIHDLAEDMYISLYYRNWFEEHGIKFPSREIAYSFSRENPIMNHEFHFDDCFGFHGKFSPKQVELLKLPFNSNNFISRFKINYCNIHSEFSLAYYIKLKAKSFFNIPLSYDELIDFYKEAAHTPKYKSIRPKGEIDLLINDPLNIHLLESVLNYAKQNIAHSIKNCFIVSEYNATIIDFCQTHKCTFIDINILKGKNVLLEISKISNAQNICLLKGNTILVHQTKLIKHCLFEINDQCLDISENTKKLFSINHCLPITFNNPIVYLNREHLDAFNTICNETGIKLLNNDYTIELYFQYVLHHFRKDYTLHYAFNEKYTWMDDALFYTKLHTPSITNTIQFTLS